MGSPVNLSIGRVRVTRVVSPSEAGYIQYVRQQMVQLGQVMEQVINRVEGVTADAIVYALKPIYDESQKLVPVDTGRLKASGFVEVRRTKGGPQAAIGYGRYGNPHYAAFVHERTDIFHRAPTQAKYLEAAVNLRLEDFRRRLVLYMQKNAVPSNG